MHPDSHGTLGIDFGTSNSAMSWAEPGGLSRLIPLEGDAVSLPTAVFFNTEDQRTHFGRDAVAQYMAGTEGRLMRSLKSLLGSPLINESTEINHRSIRFLDIVALFLAELRERATQTLGHAPERVVMGRPVHFVDDDPERDAMAQASLLEAAQTAGFRDVSFQLEPIAAALDHERRLTRESLVLIVDIGGGTSDFTVVRLGPQRMARADRSGDVLATSGVHIGGTDFDHRAQPGAGHAAAGLPPPRAARARGAQPHLLRPLDLAPDPVALPAARAQPGAGAARQLQRRAPARAADARLAASGTATTSPTRSSWPRSAAR